MFMLRQAYVLRCSQCLELLESIWIGEGPLILEADGAVCLSIITLSLKVFVPLCGESKANTSQLVDSEMFFIFFFKIILVFGK